MIPTTSTAVVFMKPWWNILSVQIGWNEGLVDTE